jgi:hypothetical protein
MDGCPASPSSRSGGFLSEGEELEDPSAGADVDQREVRMWFEQVCEQAGLRKKDQDFFWLCAVRDTPTGRQQRRWGGRPRLERSISSVS